MQLRRPSKAAGERAATAMGATAVTTVHNQARRSRRGSRTGKKGDSRHGTLGPVPIFDKASDAVGPKRQEQERFRSLLLLVALPILRENDRAVTITICSIAAVRSPTIDCGSARAVRLRPILQSWQRESSPLSRLPSRVHALEQFQRSSHSTGAGCIL